MVPSNPRRRERFSVRNDFRVVEGGTGPRPDFPSPSTGVTSALAGRVIVESLGVARPRAGAPFELRPLIRPNFAGADDAAAVGGVPLHVTGSKAAAGEVLHGLDGRH